MATVDIPKSFGALLLGGLYASLLSGFVVVQVVLYFKMYPSDHTHTKALVFIVWILDTVHTAFIWSALWSYLIGDYGLESRINLIHWDLAATIIFTAVLTFFVHIFFAYRIHIPTPTLLRVFTTGLAPEVSKRNYWLTAPIAALALLRLVSASVTMGEMLHLKTFSLFKDEFRWVFTTGLALSTAVDVLITGSLFLLLNSSKSGATENLSAVIDSLMWYTFETGSLTCAGTVIAMLCWLTMSDNLIFMGLHFVIGKLYANSLLVTLNTRAKIRRRTQGDPAEGIHVLDTRRPPTSRNYDHFTIPDDERDFKQSKLAVNVERSITYET